MSGLTEMIQAHAPVWLAVGGLVLGLIFGAIVARTNFCTMGAVSDVMNFGDWRRFRAWILAAAIALAGTQVLQHSGVVSLSRSMYLAPSLGWSGNLLGGVLFGFGMVLAGGCASRNLARIGGGDLRALVTVVVLGIFAYATIGGLLGPLRSGLEQATSLVLPTPTQSLGDLLGLMGPGPRLGNVIAASVIVAAALVFCFGNSDFRASPTHVLAGVGIGLVTAAGWALTGLAFDELADRPQPPVSLTFVRPAGDTIEWFQRFTAARMPTFAVATVLGTVLGAFVVARATGRFRVTTFSDTRDTLRNLLGAAMMGIGGVMALGCTVGQAITGVSTLALGSFLTFVAIVVGAVYGVKALEHWVAGEA